MRKPLHWILATVSLAVAGVAWHLLSAAPVPPGGAPMGSAASGGHLALPPAALPASPAAAVAPATAPSPARPAETADAGTGIGSEGFGPHVQHAIESGDARQALRAARWIASCRADRDVESMINGSHPKYRLVLPPDARAEVIMKERQNQRYCQTLTPELMAHHASLVERALAAQVPGSGLAYFDSLDLERRSPAELERALKGLRADAEQGEALAVPLLAIQALGQSRVEQLAYTKLMDLMVLKGLLPPTAGLVLPKPPDPPYSAEEQAQAGSLVTRLWPRFKPPG
ncbi:MAG: hypothetical protein EKK53_17750 [Burkholderiales bacterium]|nr:MAG: hypothetical protein EKK53_17750 [Burkholderiales bacterium]